MLHAQAQSPTATLPVCRFKTRIHGWDAKLCLHPLPPLALPLPAVWLSRILLHLMMSGPADTGRKTGRNPPMFVGSAVCRVEPSCTHDYDSRDRWTDSRGITNPGANAHMGGPHVHWPGVR